MLLHFYKYHGTGNDFIMIDNRDEHFPKKEVALVAFLCDRHFGIGADGLILLEPDAEVDFSMVYHNSDGLPGSMCGNGGRCSVAFAKHLGIIGESTVFRAVDGLHEASFDAMGRVSLKMQDVTDIKQKPNYLYLDTGSPHHVQLVANLADMDVRAEGAKLRYGLYGKKGCNINFVEAIGTDSYKVRTYERGVEDETLSCGTGVTAVALAMHHTNNTKSNHIGLHAVGGELQVHFNENSKGYNNVYLIGPAEMVFKGEIEWKG
jgi:diaminopimelate epimerase